LVGGGIHPYGLLVANQLRVPGLPFPLVPSAADHWRIDEESGTVIGSAAPGTDIFVDPGQGTIAAAESTLNAATLRGDPPTGDFQLSARVSVDFGSTYDAGVLLLWVDERCWAKLCFEFSPQREPMIVSVVCRGVADDANAFVVAGRQVWLRISRIGSAYAGHASVDGQTWRMIRYFTIDDEPHRAQVGFEAQSPTGDGCHVRFDDIRFVAERLAELRDGS
jgi:regulation of enolase protein 1 (concanavalin A-like superfamily)